MTPTETRVPAEGVKALLSRIDDSLKALWLTIESAGGSYADRNGWVDASHFYDAFEHISLAPGRRLACMHSIRAPEPDACLLIVRRPSRLRALLSRAAADRLPAPPRWISHVCFDEALANIRRRRFFSLIDDRVLAHTRSDGSAEALLELSLFTRRCQEPGNVGHFAQWGFHKVLHARPDDIFDRWVGGGSFDEMVERQRNRMVYSLDDLSIPLVPRRLERPPLPTDWAPRIVRGGTARATPELLPDDDERRARLRPFRFDVVEFYTYCGYVQQTISRHRDWFVDGERVTAETSEILNGPEGFKV